MQSDALTEALFMTTDSVLLQELAKLKLQGERLISRRKVEQRTGHSRATIWRRVAAGQFPRPVPFSANKSFWIEREIDAYITALIAKRDGEVAA
jgi:prophage regulatory protein